MDALKAVNSNRGNMEECLYDMLVVECITEGIHPDVLVEMWYMWTDSFWTATRKPKEFEGIVNWALG